jgi:predicted small secreted protein
MTDIWGAVIMAKKVLLVLVVVGMLVAAVGCNTVEGAGRDISSLGSAIAEAAHDVAN